MNIIYTVASQLTEYNGNTMSSRKRCTIAGFLGAAQRRQSIGHLGDLSPVLCLGADVILHRLTNAPTQDRVEHPFHLFLKVTTETKLDNSKLGSTQQ